jgi:DivIVA domain-containing protein
VIWVWVLLIVVLIGAVAVIAVGRGDAMAEVFDDRPDRTIPSGRPLTADDVRQVRFTTAVRGYRMDEVDAFIARLSADLLAREAPDAPEQKRLAAPPPPDEALGPSAAHVEVVAEPVEPSGWLTQPDVPTVPDADPETLEPRKRPDAPHPLHAAEGQHPDGPSHRA